MADRDRLSMAAIFFVSTMLMASKPILLHLTRGEDGQEALPPEIFQLAVEALKVIISVTVLLGRRLCGQPAPVWRGVVHSFAFLWPALVYLLMNILAVRSARLLKPPTFQLLSTAKIIYTALAAWLILDRRLTLIQWSAMALLTFGVAVNQVKWSSALESPPAWGVLLMSSCSSLSAIGGVLTERAMKSPSGVGLSIFATNLHIAAHTCLVNFAVIASMGPPMPLQLRWPNPSLLLTLINEAANGILISLIMRQAGNIVKNIAFGSSTFVTAALSASFLSYWPPLQFFIGASLTGLSVVLYSHGAPSTTDKQK